MNRDWYDVREVAKIVFMSRAWVLLMLRTGKMPGHKVGKRWVIPKVELERWMKDREDSV